MKRITNFIFFLICFCANSQNFNPKILTLSENPNIEDFSFLKEELKNVQVVMLGEKSHYDGNVFKMKTKIVKYLHQEMGFNTIAFESGVYDVWKAQVNINDGKNTKEAFEKSLFQIWSKTKEFQSFIDFYETNKSNLKLFGFDNQITGKYGEEELIKDLYEYCNKNQITKNKSYKIDKTEKAENNKIVFGRVILNFEKEKLVKIEIKKSEVELLLNGN